MFKKIFTIFLMFAFLIGCQSSNGEGGISEVVSKFTFSPKTAKINEPITFKLKITADGKNIENAQNVKFEFWLDKKADEEHMMETVLHQDNGIYSLDKSFDEPGEYSVYYHADAEGKHLMEKYQFTITD